MNDGRTRPIMVRQLFKVSMFIQLVTRYLNNHQIMKEALYSADLRLRSKRNRNSLVQAHARYKQAVSHVRPVTSDATRANLTAVIVSKVEAFVKGMSVHRKVLPTLGNFV